MKAEMSDESYGLVRKMAYKFAHGNTSTRYEEYISAGLEGLVKAIDNYKQDKRTRFSTFANTCIRNAMCTKRHDLEKRNLTQDENVRMETIDSFAEEPTDTEFTTAARNLIIKANSGNVRNAEMFMHNIGLNGEEPMGYKGLSALFGVSAERARQICVATRNKMRKDGQSLYGYVA